MTFQFLVLWVLTILACVATVGWLIDMAHRTWHGWRRRSYLRGETRYAWQRGAPLTQKQIAAAVAVAWSGPRRYRQTQPGDPATALANWHRARAVYRRTQSQQVIDVTIDVPATAPARRSALRMVRRGA